MLDQYRGAEALETHLGSPLDPAGVLSFAQAVALDEHDAYPEAACRALNAWGLAAYYVPHVHGGRLRSFEELLALVRVVARRDLTVAIAHAKTFLGAAPVWVAGSTEQQTRLAERIANHEQVALAYHEQAHGSDMNASEVRAEADGDGYRLSGEKWLVNNATRGTALTVFARTSPAGGPRGFSLFLVEKAALDPATYTHLPRLKTHGIRGADFSGIRFTDCPIPATALLGPLGGGLELSIRTFQLTRTLIPALALGAADTALRTTLAFALERKLYGDTVWALPYPRQTLVDAFVDLLVCECTTIGAARGAHVAPAQMGVWSAVVKYYVPTTVEAVVRSLAGVLGARYYLREGHQWGIFQKLVRDNAIISLFDGNTAVNLQVIAQQLRFLIEYEPGATCELEQQARLAHIFALDAPVGELDPAGLGLSNRGRDDLTQSLPAARAWLEHLRATHDGDPALLDDLATLTAALLEAQAAQVTLRAAGEARYGRQFTKSPAIFELAKRHCALHAAAACLQMWRYNRTRLGGWFGAGEWLALALERLLQTLGLRVEVCPPAYGERLAAVLHDLFDADQLFSILGYRLAPQRVSQN